MLGGRGARLQAACPGAKTLEACVRSSRSKLDIGVRSDSASSRVELFFWRLAVERCWLDSLYSTGKLQLPRKQTQAALDFLTEQSHGFCPENMPARWTAADLRAGLIGGELDVVIGWESWAASDTHLAGVAKDLKRLALENTMAGFWFAGVLDRDWTDDKFPTLKDLVAVIDALGSTKFQATLHKYELPPAIRFSEFAPHGGRPRMENWAAIEANLDDVFNEYCKKHSLPSSVDNILFVDDVMICRRP